MSFRCCRPNKIPDNTLILVIGGPQKDFLQKELAMIADYLQTGGRVIFMFDPFRWRGWNSIPGLSG